MLTPPQGGRENRSEGEALDLSDEVGVHLLQDSFSPFLREVEAVDRSPFPPPLGKEGGDTVEGGVEEGLRLREGRELTLLVLDRDEERERVRLGGGRDECLNGPVDEKERVLLPRGLAFHPVEVSVRVFCSEASLDHHRVGECGEACPEGLPLTLLLSSPGGGGFDDSPPLQRRRRGERVGGSGRRGWRKGWRRGEKTNQLLVFLVVGREDGLCHLAVWR